MAAISKELVEKYESEGKRIIRIAPDEDLMNRWKTAVLIEKK